VILLIHSEKIYYDTINKLKHRILLIHSEKIYYDILREILL